MNLKQFPMLILFMGIIMHVTSCKKDEPKPEDPTTEIEIAPNVKVLSQSMISHLNEVDTNTFTLVFSNTTANDFPAVGDILAAGVSEKTPYGLLRKITAISSNNNTITCQTTTARLDEVILKGKIELKKEKMLPSKVKQIHLEPGVTMSPTKETDVLGFDLSFEKSIGGNGAAIAYGSVYFEVGFNFSLDVDVAPPDVNLTTSIEFDQNATIGVRANGSWVTTTLQLAEIEFLPWTVMAGPVPIVFVPHAALKLTAEGSSASYVETFASENFNSELGIKYDEDWSLINDWEPAPSYELSWPNLSTNANFILKCGPEVSLKLYGMTGPFFDLVARSTLDAQVNGDNYTMTFAIALEANAGLEVSLLGFFDWDTEFNLLNKEIASLNLNNEPLPVVLRIVSPSDGSFVAIGTTVPVNIIVGDVPANGVKVFLNNELKTTLTTSPFTWNWEVNETAGIYSIRAEATIGNEIKSDEIVVNVGAADWEEVTLNGFQMGETILSVSFSDENNGFMVGVGNTDLFAQQWRFIAKTSDGGRTWTRVYENNENMSMRDVLALSSDVAFVGVDGKGMLRTSNGGATWEKVRVTNFIDLQTQIIRTTSDGVLVSAYENEIALSTEGGQDYSWLQSNYFNQIVIEPQLYTTIMDMAFGGNGVGYFLAEQGQIYKTTNNGMHWYQLPASGLPLGDGFIGHAIEVVEDGKICVAGNNLTLPYYNNGVIYLSTDDGQSFQTAQLPENYTTNSHNFPLKIFDIHFVDPNKGYAVGAFGTLLNGSSMLQSIDGGLSWTNTALQPSYPFHEMQKVIFSDLRHGYAAGYKTPALPNVFVGNHEVSLYKFGVR